MFKKVLVANRGEVAVRIIRTCKRLGVKTVAIYSHVDRDASHVRLADEAYNVGPSTPMLSYMNIERMVAVASEAHADAIHPGYGFVADHWDFAAACEKTGVTFVGPSSRTLSLSGNKAECKKVAKRVGVPVLPGTEDVVEDPDEAAEIAAGIGYPVLLKGTFGGGGRGIREAKDENQLRNGIARANSESTRLHGKRGVYLEKVVAPARHIEAQIISDGRGEILQLGERECSIQRRYQKLIELAPSPVVGDVERKKLGEYAAEIARKLDYRNAGTAEFLRDEQGRFYFVEFNSRLQVEHPVTEAVTGIDMVEEQLRVASGEGLGVRQDEIELNGAAIQCRINAEDPTAGFAPSTGRVSRLVLPGGPGIRVDTALYQGCEVTEYYDSLIAKLIAWGRDLEEARTRMIGALEEFKVNGVKTTIPLHERMLRHSNLVGWKLSTDFISENRITEDLTKDALAKREKLVEIGAAIAGAMMFEGFHRSVIIESEAPESAGRSELDPKGARFYDPV